MVEKNFYVLWIIAKNEIATRKNIPYNKAINFENLQFNTSKSPIAWVLTTFWAFESLYLNGTETFELLPEEAYDEDDRIGGDEEPGDDYSRVQDAPVIQDAGASKNVKAE